MPRYINKDSNRPPMIKKSLPDSIGKRVSRLCSSEEKFDQHKDFYEESLRRSGYDTNLTYQPPEVNRPNKKKRRRWAKMFWYNPPWSMNVKTNVAKKFFKVIRQKFQEGCSPVNHRAATRAH